jgi:hypothetical protein
VAAGAFLGVTTRNVIFTDSSTAVVAESPVIGNQVRHAFGGLLATSYPWILAVGIMSEFLGIVKLLAPASDEMTDPLAGAKLRERGHEQRGNGK